MFNRQLKRNIKDLDLQIARLNKEMLESEEGEEEKNELRLRMVENLTKIRCQLAESKVKESYKAEIISGSVSLIAIVLVLKYEERDIITTKAMNFVSKLYRGM